MRYLIEIFDRDAMENVVGTCAFQPEVVVFLCDKNDSAYFKESAIYRLFRRRKIKTVPKFHYFDTDSPADIRRTLRAVVKDYPGCVFDYSGGKDLVLLEAGAYCIANGVPGYYISLRHRRLINVHKCEDLEKSFVVPHFSTEDLLAIKGATVLGSGHFSAGELSQSFEATILPIWDIVQENPAAWGGFVGFLQEVCGGTPVANTQVFLYPKQMRQRYKLAILRRLEKVGVLQLQSQNNGLMLTFQSPLYKKCLLNQGVWLELYSYIIAKNSGFFTDVRTSVMIDWDGVDGGVDTTKNEVDVLLMKEIIPVFISCKMSLPSALALSEIKLLSVKFGGKQSRCVLITAGRLGAENKAIKTRAVDLGVTLLDIDNLNADNLAHALQRVANGS